MLIIVLLIINEGFGQLGKTYKETQRLYPNTIIALRNEGNLLVEDKQVSDKEVRMIMYNSDSNVVVVVIGFLDSALTDSGLITVIKKELPQFYKTKFAKNGDQTLWLDSINNYLVVLHPVSPSQTFPLAGLSLLTDPSGIRFWIQGITSWRRE
jgi:hypothetical protein